MIENKEVHTLMLKAKEGDSNAFALLYEELYTPIFRFIYSKCGEKNLAEDLTQTTFLKSFKALNQFSADSEYPIAYFYTIARNLLTDFYRKKKDVLISKKPDEENSTSLFENIEDSELTPEKELEQKDQKYFMQGMLDKLPENYREVMELKFLQDLSNKEIAKKLNKTEMNVRQIQVRALKKLKVYMEN